jgi:hypothetical protein
MNSYHFVRYRPAPEGDDNVVTSPKKTKSEAKAAKSSHKRKSEDLWTGKCEKKETSMKK